MDSVENKKIKISFEEIFDAAPVGILIFNDEWEITHVNQNLIRFGVIKDEFGGYIIHKNILKQEIFENIEIVPEVKKLFRGEPFEKELINVKTFEGGELSILVKGAPLFEGEKFLGGILIVEDIKIGLEVQKEKLIRSKYFADLLNGISSHFFITDSSGKLKYSSINGEVSQFKSFLTNYGGKSNSLFSLISSNKLKDLFTKINETKAPINAIVPTEISGDHFNYRVTLVPLLSANNVIQFIIVLLTDITKEAENLEYMGTEINELRTFRDITLAIVDAVINVDINGRIILWNEKAEKVFGYSSNEVLNQFVGKILPSISEEYFQRIREELKKTSIWESEVKIVKDKDEAEYLSIKMGIVGKDENQSIVMLCSNITRRALMERELRQSEERFRNIVTNTREYICTLDLNEKITYVNPYFSKTFDYSQIELLGKNFKDLIEDGVNEKKNFSVEKIIKEKTESLELQLVKRDGAKVYVLSSFTPVKDFNGKIRFYNVVLTDITVKKEAEKDLLLVRSVFDASQDGIGVITNKELVLVNENFARIFGYDEIKEVLGKSSLDFVDDVDKARVSSIIKNREEGKHVENRYDFVGIKKDKSKFYVEASVTSYVSDNITYTVSVMRDITEQKKAAEKLKESEERYRSITENINESMWTAELIDGKLQAVFYTSAIKKITGYSNEDFISNKKLWFNIIHPNDSEFVIKKLKRLYRDPARTSDEIEYRIQNNIGNIIWIENKINVVRSGKGQIQKVYGVVSDITLNKKADEEFRKSAENLKQLNETKDRFISIISHDLRTPFSSILGFTDLLLTDRHMPEEKKIQYVEFIQESSRNMLSLVNSLLDWTRVQTGRIRFEPERMNAKFVVTKAIQMLSGSALQKNINLYSAIDTDMYIYADENLVLQTFNNLISNAIKFTRQNGTISINGELLIDERKVKFTVKDNGVGIREDDLPKLFKVDTKFTLKGTEGEKGSGLGLSLVHDIVQKHGGDIWVESKYGSGSEFIFTIPIASTKILIADDINTDRILYAKLIKSIMPNYDVLEAKDGKEAFEIIKSSQPALVISDHKMPVMSGYDLVKQMKVTDLKYIPPVIILSSDLNNTIVDEYKEMGIEYIFAKPVNLSNFKVAIDNSLKKAIFN